MTRAHRSRLSATTQPWQDPPPRSLQDLLSDYDDLSLLSTTLGIEDREKLCILLIRKACGLKLPVDMERIMAEPNEETLGVAILDLVKRKVSSVSYSYDKSASVAAGGTGNSIMNELIRHQWRIKYSMTTTPAPIALSSQALAEDADTESSLPGKAKVRRTAKPEQVRRPAKRSDRIPDAYMPNSHTFEFHNSKLVSTPNASGPTISANMEYTQKMFGGLSTSREASVELTVPTGRDASVVAIAHMKVLDANRKGVGINMVPKLFQRQSDNASDFGDDCEWVYCAQGLAISYDRERGNIFVSASL